ncbi:MAG: hypothetical protein J6U87_02645, partial [Clostridia bacterium]|nr:hypothetical protein [Clostridia bacterium]
DTPLQKPSATLLFRRILRQGGQKLARSTCFDPVRQCVLRFVFCARKLPDGAKIPWKCKCFVKTEKGYMAVRVEKRALKLCMLHRKKRRPRTHLKGRKMQKNRQTGKSNLPFVAIEK